MYFLSRAGKAERLLDGIKRLCGEEDRPLSFSEHYHAFLKAVSNARWPDSQNFVDDHRTYFLQ